MIAYMLSANQLLNASIDNLTNMVDVVNYTVDYDGDLQSGIDQLQEQIGEQQIRITIINSDGDVLADTDAEESTLENHGNREEVITAFAEGSGYATRYSDTLDQDMLYVAKYIPSQDVVVRISVEHTGLEEYMKVFFPILLITILVSMMVALVVATTYANSITKPLDTIVKHMQAIQNNEFHFEISKYRYEELNIISDTTVSLTSDIRRYIKKRELEKRIRQEFFSNASHELKTPITSIRGYAELIDSGLVTDVAGVKDCTGRILTETEHMTTLINDILMISRLEANEVKVDLTRVRIAPIIQDVLDTLKPQAMEQEVVVHSECEPISIYANHKQMVELLSNLISNGVKYNRPGGHVWIKVYQHRNHIYIQVKDDGMGITQQDRKRIFERFYCVDKGRSKKMGGTGLGLSIVKHIVEYNKGTIELTSEVGVGSTFDISLPMCEEPDSNA